MKRFFEGTFYRPARLLTIRPRQREATVGTKPLSMADAGLLDDTQSEETTFIPDDISAIIKEARAPSPPTAHAPWLANYRVL